MKPLTLVAYTAHGRVRGGCGHRHQTVALADRCALADQKRCDRRGAYSDRRVVPWLAGDTLIVDGRETWIAGDVQAYATVIADCVVVLPAPGSVFSVAGYAWEVGPAAPRRTRPPKDQMTLPTGGNHDDG